MLTPAIRTAAISAALIATLVASNPAEAVPIDVAGSGLLIKDVSTASIFGITDASSPFSLSFTADSDAATYVPAGTLVTGSSSFASDLYLFDSAGITNFIFNLGNQSFSSVDLISQQLGTSTYSYSVLLAGALSGSGVSGSQFNLNSGSGIATLGTILCGSESCFLGNSGYAEDDIELSVGTFAGIQTLATAPPTSVPEPATLTLFGLGLAGIGLARRKRQTTSH